MNFTSCALHLPEPKEGSFFGSILSNLMLLARGDDYVGLGTLKATPGGQVWSMQDGNVLPLDAVTHYAYLPRVKLFTGKTQDVALQDEDGCPTNAAHAYIRNWSWADGSEQVRHSAQN